MLSKEQKYWDERYETNDPRASGTFAHSVGANRWFYRAKFRRLASILRQHNVPREGGRVLDAACGVGTFVDGFRRLGAAEVVGADFSSVAISKCEQRFAGDSSVTFHCADLSQELPVHWHGHFDLVCVFEAIFCIVDSDRFERALHNLAATVRPGGHLVISDRFPEKLVRMGELQTYHARSTYDEILAQEGMQIEAMYVQTRVFNRALFPVAMQAAVEKWAPQLLYVLDGVALHLPISRSAESHTIKYAVIKKPAA